LNAIATKSPPRETVELRRGLRAFLNQSLSNFIASAPTRKNGKSIAVGGVKWGAYAFLDYEGEPIYVGQTRESLGSRIGRHLTNQRTDAVAMSVLDPFEVRFIRVWPLPQYQDVKGAGPEAQSAADHLNAVERTVFVTLVEESRFGRILNEKDPPDVALCDLPTMIGGEIVLPEVLEVRGHPDTRIARRAQTLARLSAIIAGRDVAGGLRRSLVTQAQRLAWLAEERFTALGGEALVPHRSKDEPTEGDVDSEQESQDD
jgi:hypothetical protein